MFCLKLEAACQILGIFVRVNKLQDEKFLIRGKTIVFAGVGGVFFSRSKKRCFSTSLAANMRPKYVPKMKPNSISFNRNEIALFALRVQLKRNCVCDVFVRTQKGKQTDFEWNEGNVP